MISKLLFPGLWLTAFLCSLFFINDWQLELFGSAIIILFVWAVIGLSDNLQLGWQIPKSWPLRIMGLFWLLAFLSILNSEILNVSLMAFCFFSVMPLTFFVLAIQGEEKQFEFIAKVLAVVFAGLSIWAMLQFFVFSDYFGGRAHHPLKNPNSLAALFSLGFFCSVGWMLGAKGRIQSNLALVLSILIFGGIIATGSRGALLAMLPVFIFFLIVMRAQAKQHWRCLAILFVSCAALFASSVFGSVATDNIANRVGDIVSAKASGIDNDRLKLWAASLRIIKEHGLLGTGIGTYFLYFPEFRLSEDLKGAYYAHNDPLQYWVELGVLGPVLFYAFIISVIIRTVKAFKAATDVTKRLKIFVPFCALGAVIIHTHVTFNLYNLSILFIIGILLAVWFHATQSVLKTDVKEVKFPQKYSVFTKVTMIALPFLCVGFLFSAYIVSEHYTNKARDHLLAGELEEFADDVVLANRISFQNNYRSYILAVNVPLTLLENPKGLNDEQKEDIFNQGLSYLRHVRAINPRSSSALFYLAKIQQVSPPEFIPDDLKTPEEYYLQALAIDPLHLGARMELAAIYDRRGEGAKALSVLEEGSYYQYSTSKAMEFYGRLLQIYLKNGNAEKRDYILVQMRGFQSRLAQSEKKKNKTIYQSLFF